MDGAMQKAFKVASFLITWTVEVSTVIVAMSCQMIMLVQYRQVF